LPKPGEGPSPIQQERGFFDLRLFGRTNDGRNLRVKVTGDRDPGYGSTAKMLGEAAACLAFDVSRAEVGGGFWTPASALGEKLLARLQAHAGLGFERQDD
ncbi:MAG: saccharopine dehydrogenase, partial [Steroidobacteraceae bacterium]